MSLCDTIARHLAYSSLCVPQPPGSSQGLSSWLAFSSVTSRSRWEQSGILFTATLLESDEQLLRSRKPKTESACHLPPRLPSVPPKRTIFPLTRSPGKVAFLHCPHCGCSRATHLWPHKNWLLMSHRAV